jgi:excisionase family DNA binding protein
MSQQAIEKKFCTTKEAAIILGVSVGTVQQWVESGLLEAWKTVGGHRRVTRESVEKLLHKPAQGKLLAAAPSAALSSASTAPTEAGLRRMRVLVLEDDPDLLTLYKIKISTWPMKPEIVGVPNAVSALIAIGRSVPDLLIADMRMSGGVDGFDMLRQMHKTPEMANTTIVVVSGMDAAEIQARGGIPSDIEVLPKPIPFHRLQDIAGAIVSKSPYISH